MAMNNQNQATAGFVPDTPSQATAGFVPDQATAGFVPDSPVAQSAQRSKSRGVFGNLVRGVVQGVARPFLRGAQTLASGPVAVGGLAKAGFEAATGRGEQARRTLERTEEIVMKPRDLGFFGEDLTPVGVTREGEAKTTLGFIADLAGFGLEVGSTVLGGKLASQAVKQGVQQTTKQAGQQTFRQILRNSFRSGKKIRDMRLGSLADDFAKLPIAKQGALTAATEGFGAGLQEDEDQIVNGIVNSGIGLGAGYLLAGLGDAFIPTMKKIFGQSPLRTAREAAGEIVESTPVVRNVASKLEASSEARKAANEVRDSLLEVSTNPKQTESAVSNLILGGAEPEDLAIFKVLNNDELQTTLEMFDVAERRAANKLANRDLPRNVLGKKTNDRIVNILELRNDAGKSLGKLRENLPGKTFTPEQVSSVENTLLDIMQRRGLTVGADNKIVGTANLTIPEGKLKFYQGIWDDIVNQDLTPTRADSLRTKLFADYENLIAKEGPNTTSLQRTIKNDIQSIRTSLLAALDGVQEGFQEQSERFAISEELVDNWLKAIGATKKNVNDMTKEELRDSFDDYASNTLRRLQTNASQRMYDVIADLKRVEDYFGITNAENLDRLTFMSLMLEDLFDISRPGSFKGRTQAGTQAAAQAVETAADAATGNVFSLARKFAAPFVGAEYTPNQRKYLRQLLESLVGQAK